MYVETNTGGVSFYDNLDNYNYNYEESTNNN